MFKIGFYQFRPVFGRPQKNLSRVILKLKNASADVIVLPELPFSGYYFKDRDEVKELSEATASSPIVESLISLCRDRDFYLVSGFAEKHADKYFNSSLLIGPEGLIHTYRKIHLFNEEKNWFDKGDTALQINNVRGAKIGMMICFDWIFPETARVLAMQGADIICHPSNLVLAHCQDAMITRCTENMVFAVTTNRFGSDARNHGTIKFTGKSQIAAPKGVLIRRAPSQREELFVTEINPALARNKKITPNNDILADRRPNLYKTLTRDS
jgi:predicted amidohydrolase